MNVTSLIALQSFKGISRKTATKVANELPGDPVDFRDYVKLKFSRGELEIQRAWDQALQIIDRCEELGIRPVAVTDDACYPERLYSLNAESPPVLYIKGAIEALQYDSEVIAIVGTRTPTENGIIAAYELGCVSANNHIPVVSGLASGCDASGHIGCLKRGGVAIAVMAHGLDMVYPSEHWGLREQILEQNGCLVSEYPPGIKSAGWRFVDRDRIQSGLSDVVIVIQTGKHGGTHHTAEAAQKQGRRIYCMLPQKFDDGRPSVEGTYDIIDKWDAEWLTNPEQLLSIIDGQYRVPHGVNKEVQQLEFEF